MFLMPDEEQYQAVAIYALLCRSSVRLKVHAHDRLGPVNN